MYILAIISGEYGRRHVQNILAHKPQHWAVETWQAPANLPIIMDYPEDYLPEKMDPAQLLLSFAEQRGVAELIPEIAGLTGAGAVIAPVDNEAWLPRGLARQLRGWLEAMHVACVTPKPLCSLSENRYQVSRRIWVDYHNPLIGEFARYFGRPELKVSVQAESRRISAVEVRRDAVCGCARFVAERLVGVLVDEAEEQAGLAHHHYPCLASMGIDSDFGDTLMHVSGNILRDAVAEQIRPYKRPGYITPGELSE
jgi:thymidylate synthase